jgi:hypothetical protein
VGWGGVGGGVKAEGGIYAWARAPKENEGDHDLLLILLDGDWSVQG